MQRFEFALILVSIILGLGITELLKTLARALRGEIRGSLVHVMWSVQTLLLLLQQFWSKWAHQSRAEWDVMDMTLFLTPSLLGFMAAAMLSPARIEEDSLADYFLRRRRPFFVILILLMLSYSVEGWELLQGPRMGSANVVRGIYSAVYVVGIFSASRAVQVTAALSLSVATVLFALGWTPSLG